MNQARVGRLTLAAPDEALVRRGASLLEDAMNVATLQAAADRRHFIVRHFDVGVIAADAAPQTLALEIERRLAHVQLTAVRATDPGAADARVVYFADDLTAIVELARRLVAGPEPREWFWPHVAGGAVNRPAHHALAACVAAAAALPAGPLAIAEVVAAIEAIREGALLATLQPADVTPLLQLTFGGTSLPAPPTGAAATTVAGATVLPVWRARLARWIPRWRGDGRAHWLAAIASIHTRRTVRPPAAELAVAAATVAAELERTAIERDRIEPERTPPSDEQQRARSETAAEPAPPLRARSRIVVEDVAEAPAAVAAEPELSTLSMVAGALLAIRPLAALGMPGWLDEHEWAAAGGFGAHVLAMLAAAELPDFLASDPLVDGLGGVQTLDGPFVAPASWRPFFGARPAILRRTDDHGRVLFAHRVPIAAWRGRRTARLPWSPRQVKRGAPVEDRAWALAAWRGMLARWLRRFTGMSLGDLVRRPGMVASTPTHLEVTWPLRTVELRIRAAGLDVDPGWVPWLGRIVTFRYSDKEH